MFYGLSQVHSRRVAHLSVLIRSVSFVLPLATCLVFRTRRSHRSALWDGSPGSQSVSKVEALGLEIRR